MGVGWCSLSSWDRIPEGAGDEKIKRPHGSMNERREADKFCDGFTDKPYTDNVPIWRAFIKKVFFQCTNSTIRNVRKLNGDFFWLLFGHGRWFFRRYWNPAVFNNCIYWATRALSSFCRAFRSELTTVAHFRWVSGCRRQYGKSIPSDGNPDWKLYWAKVICIRSSIWTHLNDVPMDFNFKTNIKNGPNKFLLPRIGPET